MVAGKRLAENAVPLPEGACQRLGGRVPESVTGGEHAAYPEALLAASGAEAVPPRAGRPGRPAGPRLVPPEGPCRAAVHKTRAKGRVAAAPPRVALGELPRGAGVSTSYPGRHSATDRRRSARKGRKAYASRRAGTYTRR